MMPPVAVATMATLIGSTDESSIRCSGFHGVDDLDLAVVPVRTTISRRRPAV